MKRSGRKMTGKGKLVWGLLILGFMCMEFPGVFFFQHKTEPFIFGFPFIYGFNLVMWIYMCIIIFVGYKINWGEPQGTEKPGK